MLEESSCLSNNSNQSLIFVPHSSSKIGFNIFLFSLVTQKVNEIESRPSAFGIGRNSAITSTTSLSNTGSDTCSVSI